VAAIRTIVVGLGITGLSCVRYFVRNGEGANLTVVDTRSTPPGLDVLRSEHPEVTVLTGVSELDFTDVSRLVVSPGVPLDDEILSGCPSDVQIVSDIDLFCEAAAAPVVAVTGTNGKSTVTALVGHLLNAAGVRAVVGGNLGEAALDLLLESAEVYVLELSSFQLERLAGHHFAAATILNVTEDHLDRHGDMAAYVAAKQRIYRDCALAVAHRGEPATYPETDCEITSFGSDMPGPGEWGILEINEERWLACGDEAIVASSALPIAGAHNELNALAAMALARAMGASTLAMAGAVSSFTGLPHRCQRVSELGGVSYINDSKATNVGATCAALVGLGDIRREQAPHIVLIAGGDGKGADFSPLAEVVARFAKAVVLIGRDGPQLAAALGDRVLKRSAASMQEAVELATDLAGPGDLVLLSPACASFDMYDNFSARGEDFSRCVEALAA
jgi:UDP-N-acetylmuramoylalanine--D-glutamate ligase